MAGSKSGLNDQQKKFADEFLLDFNGTQAAIRAGYSKKTAYSQAHDLLKKPEIQAYLKTKKKKTADKLELSQKRVLLELTRLAFSDLRNYFNADGTPKPITELSDDAAAALASSEIEIRAGKIVKSKPQQPSVTISRLKLWDKSKAIEMLAKHFHIFDEIGPGDVHNHIDLSKLSPEDLKAALALLTKMK